MDLGIGLILGFVWVGVAYPAWSGGAKMFGVYLK